MALSGGFAGLSPSDLLQMLSWGAKTGLLTCNRNEDRRHVFLFQGDVVGVTSSRYRDRLGAVLLRLGFVTEEQFNDVLNLQASNGRHLGEMFKDKKIVSESQLQSALSLQAEDIIFDLLAWTDGDFAFEERSLSDEEHKLQPIVISNLLMEGARRIDEINRVKDKLDDTDMVFCLVENVDLNVLSLSRAQRSIADMLRTPWSLGDIQRMVNESEYDTLSSLYYLLEKNIILESEKATLQRKERKVKIQNLMETSETMENKGWFHEALNTIEEILQKNPEYKDAELVRTRLRDKILLSAKSVFTSLEMIPTIRHSVAAVSADKLCLNQREGLVFFRIDGCTNLKNLRYITSMTENELYIILHKFIRMGLIYLDDRPVKIRKSSR